jgi:signal transduction histidine kinase
MINKLYLTRKVIENLSPIHSSVITGLDLSKLLGDLEEQIGRMSKIVSNLQDLGRLEPVVRDTDVKRLVSETLSTITVPKTVKLSVEIEADVPIIVIDPVLMRHALANLIINAIQSMPSGGNLRIRGSRNDSGVNIAIQDTGVGIPKESLNEILSPVYPIRTDGTRFGLTISKRFVESHNGTIEVESDVSKGSTFTIKLPLN